MSRLSDRLAPRVSGFTFIELLIAVAIVGLISSIAYPTYVNKAVESNRSAAKSALSEVAERQEQYFLDTKRYATNLQRLGYSASPFMVDNRGGELAAASEDRVYRIELTAVDDAGFTLRAVPQLWQASKDTDCGSLTLASDGQRGQTGSATDCW